MWKRRTYIISDTHFNHQFMIDKKIRPEYYDRIIIENWKRKVRSIDTIIHLWDVIFSRPSELTTIMKDLPWYKILILGNHDRNSVNWYLSHWFNEVHSEYFIYLSNKKRIHLTHKPIKTELDYNICGHLHDYENNNTFRHKECLNLSSKSRIYSAEIENYMPILLDNILSAKHHSHLYIMKQWRLKIYMWYWWNKLMSYFKR